MTKGYRWTVGLGCLLAPGVALAHGDQIFFLFFQASPVLAAAAVAVTAIAWLRTRSRGAKRLLAAAIASALLAALQWAFALNLIPAPGGNATFIVLGLIELFLPIAILVAWLVWRADRKAGGDP